MRKIVQDAWANLFGPSRNDKYTELLQRIAHLAVECAALFRKTEAGDSAGIIELERKADRVVDEIHELLDNAFILRFDIPDAMRLADELDDVIDGMRKVALHIDAYKIHLTAKRPEALELMDLSGTMLQRLELLVAMLAEPRLSLVKVRELANEVDEMESRADRIVADHERHLVEEFSRPGASALGFIAWHQLFHLLEQITDDANGCASLILSLARKEA
jgi:hypothetical protein